MILCSHGSICFDLRCLAHGSDQMRSDNRYTWQVCEGQTRCVVSRLVAVLRKSGHHRRRSNVNAGHVMIRGRPRQGAAESGSSDVLKEGIGIVSKHVSLIDWPL
jgi:hypothetical protein